MPQLIVFSQGRELSRVPIRCNVTDIGRDRSCAVTLDAPGVSRAHASVEFDGARFWVVDNRSTNGLYVNGQRQQRSPISAGDPIRIGRYILQLTLDGGVPISTLSQQRLSPSPTDRISQVQDPGFTTALRPAEIERLLQEDVEASRSTPAAIRPKSAPRHPIRQIALALGALTAVIAGVTTTLLWGG